MAIDEGKLNDLLGKAIVDFGATMNAPLILIGEKLGLYRALAENGPLTSEGLASQTGTTERYVREWALAQAASGYIDYDSETKRYSLSEEQIAMFVDGNSPAFVIGGFQSAIATSKSEGRLLKAFQTGEGVGWHEHDCGLFEGTERFFRPGYNAHLVNEWIPALEGVEEKLKRGARIADVGCGHGSSTILMAQAYPNSTFVGFDYHEDSIASARERAEDAGVSDRVRFGIATAKTFNGASYDLVTVFDALHDLGDPVGAAEHVRETLSEDGTWLIVEPFANDQVEDNFNPLGRAYYAGSTMLCTPNSLSQEVGLALGAQAGETRIREVVHEGGFSRFRRAAATPTNLVFEAKP